MIVQVKQLRKGDKFRDTIKGQVKSTEVQSVGPCPSQSTKTHINQTDCWDSDYPVDV